MNKNGLNWGWSIGSPNWRWPQINPENVLFTLFMGSAFASFFIEANFSEPIVVTGILWLAERNE